MNCITLYFFVMDVEQGRVVPQVHREGGRGIAVFILS